MFNFIKQTFKTIYTQFSSKLSQLLNRQMLDEHSIKELEKLLLSADTGIATTQYILEQLKASNGQKPLRESLCDILSDILYAVPQRPDISNVFLIVGINGSGKTTFVGKLAYHYVQQGKRVLLVAADTFRAAATAQLKTWADQAGATLITGTPGQDPASIVFMGCKTFVTQAFDILIIDTAGRLQNRVNLMQELAKIKNVVSKQLPHETVHTLLTIDAMIGQNSFEQAEPFRECTALSGIVLTKMDSTGKGGIVFAIAKTYTIPVWYVSYGEKIDQMMRFDIKQYVHGLVYERI